MVRGCTSARLVTSGSLDGGRLASAWAAPTNGEEKDQRECERSEHRASPQDSPPMGVLVCVVDYRFHRADSS